MEKLHQFISAAFDKVEKQVPIVQSITNTVTINDCANIILASGGSPTMAEYTEEVEEIQTGCQGLVINIGTLHPLALEAMIKAGTKANELGHPVILDPVGAGASKLRNDAVKKLLEEVNFSVIRGNISEMKAIKSGEGTTAGVDASPLDLVTEENLEEALLFAKELSAEVGSVIAVSGAIDIVADAGQTFVIRNGHAMMAKVTGTGCMVTNVIGVFCSVVPDQPLEAAVTALTAYGLSGERAYQKVTEENSGTSSFRMHLIDHMSKMTAGTLLNGMKAEVYS